MASKPSTNFDGSNEMAARSAADLLLYSGRTCFTVASMPGSTSVWKALAAASEPATWTGATMSKLYGRAADCTGLACWAAAPTARPNKIAGVRKQHRWSMTPQGWLILG
ncbi:MAG: hypothetical protein NTW21_32505 [Verrucomicrobia bacterium]|nr:hypothetical protein [Verrucomicrobiota bacterium]